MVCVGDLSCTHFSGHSQKQQVSYHFQGGLHVRSTKISPHRGAAAALRRGARLGAAWSAPAPSARNRPRKPIPRRYGTPNMLSEAFNHAAEVAMPSVVTIYSKTKSQPVSGTPLRLPQGDNPFKGTPFEEFFEGRRL